MNRAGTQVMLINEYDQRFKYYKYWESENDLRDIAQNFSNAYVLAFYACCREVYNHEKHKGFRSREEALKSIDKLTMAIAEIVIEDEGNDFDWFEEKKDRVSTRTTAFDTLFLRIR